MLEFAFMVFGMGFFLFVIWLVVIDEEKRYQRRLSEAREFGFGGKDQHTVKSLKDR